MIRKTLVYFTICTMLLAGLPLAVSAATVNTSVNVSVSAVDQVGDNGYINWDEGFVEAIGTGAPSSMAKSPAQARLMARRAAIADAQRNLLESVEGVQVTAETTVGNFLTNDIAKTKLSGMIEEAKIVKEQQLADGTCQVTLRVSLYGANGLSKIINDAITPATTAPVPLPTPSPAYKPTAMPEYTGLVVDVTGLPLSRAMSPVIFDDTGRPIYGHENLIPDYVVSQGMIDYLCTPEDIRKLVNGQSRAGAAPITVKAIGLRNHNVNIIISQTDADRILAANAQSSFLPKAMVCVRQ